MNDVPGPIDTTAVECIEPPWSIGLLVRRLIGARHGGPAVTAERVLSAVQTAEHAYQVQARLDASLWPQASPTVWKAGADSRDALPTAAPIAPSLVHASGAVLSAAKFPICIVEAAPAATARCRPRWR